jgi:microcin C transport system substrate-binding protein
MVAGQRLPLPDWIGPAAADSPKHVWRHGLAKFGELKYPAGFKQFDYVNPNPPKTGGASQIALGTFDNFNMVVAGVKGTLVQGIDFVYDTFLRRPSTKCPASMDFSPNP